ncbi:autotransporter assembly complex protein TamA [Lysobacter niastensis]|uniref:Translocation and assembly module subunit TamA n=1 Tax=Lysobacter niastensis TaxID=380629 RepID=A0ABS0B893_9GAMM|nr:autotransporter assembly complex family protein [Lysobacter niastensis]MBF6023340.1 outer membrane protein assembly factor [Lysobacter niastensis]
MPPTPCRLLAAALILSASGAAQAAKVTGVQIQGLDETKTLNVHGALSLVDTIGKEVSGRRLAYLLREAEDETREALEPFGYYSPQIEVERIGESDALTVAIKVTLGEPVRVRRADIAILGEGSEDRYLNEDLAAFKPRQGDVFDHAAYEASKTRITRRLAERGYFDADFSSRQVEVTRAERAADIDLVWSSGGRYDMGPITFVQTPKHIIRDSLLDKLVYWEQGSYYHQGKLDRFRESLTRLDYFSSIEIETRPEAAVDNEVPVAVTLTPAKRTVYTAGLSYGTDSGAGVRLGMERRYVNDRGHKALGQIDWAETRKTATAQYRIPAFAWLDGWFTISGQYYDEQSDYIDIRKVEFVGSRSGQINRRLNAVASLHALRERWSYVADDDNDETTPVQYRYATFLYPSLRGEYIDADDRIFPRNGLGITVEVRGGLEGVGSDANFAQAWGIGRWYRGLGAFNRLILRAEAGGTFTNALVDMPPSLRFFAGGDRSIRGYAFREVGPTTIGSDGKKYALGAKNVLTGSVEFEHYINDTWGGAAFVDAGDAFDDTPDIHTGVGVGVRWRSPVGPVRLDIAHGLKDPDSQYEIYLNIGADW